MGNALHKRNRVGNIVINGLYVLICLGYLIPLLMVFSVSITSQDELMRSGFQLIPQSVSWYAYEVVLRTPETIVDAYMVTIVTSVGSLAIYLTMASMCAYALSRHDFAWRNSVSFYLFFTMMFSGGLVPTYLLVTQYLGLRNNIWALILTQVGNVWHIFLMRTYFQDIPTSILESATIDGANEWQKFLRIVLPLAIPSIATIGLLNFVNYWNSWYNALLYITDKRLRPLQYLLQVMLRNINEMKKAMQASSGAQGLIAIQDIPTEPLQMAMCVLTIGPVMLFFPFFQKYLVKGLTVGSVKG